MARLMGLPPELGLFTSILTAPVTALLGRNPVLIGGTASATVPFIAAAVQSQGVGGAAKVCLAASVFLMVFCVLRLGRYVAKVPHAVVSGFSCGVGAMMVILQLRTLLGLPAVDRRRLDQPARAARRGLLGQLGQARWEPMLLGSIVIAGGRRRGPALAAVARGLARRRPGGRRRPSCSAGANDRRRDVALNWPPLAGFTWGRPTSSTSCRRRWGWLSWRRSTS